MNTARTTIELHNVARTFGGPIKRAITGGKPALDGATATLEMGRVYGLIGRNGSGKTTLLRALAGQLRVTGEILYEGQPVWDNEVVLDNLILAGADVPWPNDVKVSKLFAIAANRWSTWDQHYADKLIEDYELDTSKRLPALSRGQKSIVSIVMGLAAQCPVTLLDEPYLGLDVQNREMFYRHLLEDVERNPRTFIISTHHIDDVARVLDAVMLLDRGRITGVSDLNDLTERVALLSGSSSAVEAQLAALQCAPDSLLSDATSAGVRKVTLDLHSCPSTIPMRPERLTSLLEGTGVRFRLADLEQAVLAMTGRDIAEEDAHGGPTGVGQKERSAMNGVTR
ncbi:ABC transporter ATP-binding protein YtrB [Corynebacterium urogenitale]|uniref:ABC transporter ATP-binding protein YtrB n=1 Tax=Corynebacterium urogenitale TaxID=2487892 RepID=A0A5J6Z5C6_9CORY|nr:ABC transporter ATP-binding protein [Corynebacterium urogenitale]QFQ01561.1 ABC transporter ATP-binding protein YtrB [Corynebacterium urogenitale]